MKLKPIISIEDDENDIFLMRRAFKECGIANPLVPCSDGQEAIDTLAQFDDGTPKLSHDNFPALILLDLNLPGKTGHDVLRWVRGNDAFRHLVVVVLTSSSHHLDVHKAYSLGANAYVVKPPMFDALVETVKTIRDFWLKQNLLPPFISESAGSAGGVFSN